MTTLVVKGVRCLTVRCRPTPSPTKDDAEQHDKKESVDHGVCEDWQDEHTVRVARVERGYAHWGVLDNKASILAFLKTDSDSKAHINTREQH